MKTLKLYDAYYVTSPEYTYMLIVNKKNIVTKAPPCAAWMKGKSMVEGGALRTHLESMGGVDYYGRSYPSPNKP